MDSNDLYYRLNVSPVHVPPLRDRKYDIPLLATFYLEKYATKMGKKFRGIKDKKMKKLMDYSWPGNIRELRHVIERAVIISEGESVYFPRLISKKQISHKKN